MAADRPSETVLGVARVIVTTLRDERRGSSWELLRQDLGPGPRLPRLREPGRRAL